jgi:hypothetical protein
MNKMGILLEVHADKGKRLTVRKVSIDRNEPNEPDPAPPQDYVSVEGDSDSLRFLGELLIAFAEGDFGCNFDLHPQGAGSAHFTTASNIGIELHKTPCDFNYEAIAPG